MEVDQDSGYTGNKVFRNLHDTVDTTEYNIMENHTLVQYQDPAMQGSVFVAVDPPADEPLTVYTLNKGIRLHNSSMTPPTTKMLLHGFVDDLGF